MTEFKETELDERAIKMAKVLSADAVERAGHGHPGSPVSLAPIAYTLYQHFIKHDPNDPNWEGRDRFILSGGHASLTQYVQLYFSGYGLTLDDLKNFRGGADTRTPGHPEYGLTPGIEMTTGPLGQGFASAIGFAYGQRFQRGLLDPEAPAGESPFDHNIWVICGEGDIEEGISGEAASLAANQQLGNLTVIFDANRIQIEGDTNLVLAEDVLKRFQAYGWYTDEFSFIQPDGSYKEDIEGLADVIAKAEKAAPDQPKLIKVHSLIAWPTPGKTNDPSSHGSKLGAEAVAGLKELLGYDPEESFHVDEEALAHARKVAERGLEAHKEWDEKFDAWRKANPDKAALYDRIKAGEDFDTLMNEYSEDTGLSNNPNGYTFTEGQMVTEFYDGAKALAEDEVSELVKSDYGYHIIKRVKLDDSQLDNYKNDIVSAISGSMDELLQQWMDEAQVETTDLYSTITYENVYDYLPQDVQSLVTRPGSDAAQTTDEQSATEQSNAQ